jgi:hypothetical protein
MKTIESLNASLQSNIGQHMAGVQIPATDAEIPIPFVDYNFDNKLVLGAGLVVGAYGVVKTLRHQDRTNNLNNVEVYPAGSDFAEITKQARIRGRAKDLGLGLLAALGITSGVLALAGPYSEETNTNIDSISIIVDSSAQGLTEDVEGNNGQPVARIKAAVDEINGFDGLPDRGITITYIAAGTTAEAVATVKPGDDRNVVVDGYEAYIGNEVNLGTGSNAVPDIEGALRAATAANSQAAFVIAGSLEGVDGSLLEGESDSEEHNIVIVATGTPGSTVTDKAGNEIEAPINKSYNDLVLGEEDSFVATSQSDLSKIINNVIDEQYVRTERNEVNGFRNFAVTSLALLGVGTYMRFGKKSKINTPKKGK